MSIDLQCDTDLFCTLIERRVRSLLYSQAVDPFMADTGNGSTLHYVDLIDMVKNGVSGPDLPSDALGNAIDDALDFGLSLELALTEREQVLSRPMARPDVNLLKLRLNLRLQVERRKVEGPVSVWRWRQFLVGKGSDVDFGPWIEDRFASEAERSAMHQRVLQYARKLIEIDLINLYNSLGLGLPAFQNVDLSLAKLGDRSAVALRFDPDSEAVRRLDEGQEWGLWLSAALLCEQVRNEINAAFSGGDARIVNTALRWNPRGGVAAVDADLDIAITLPNPFGEVPATMSLRCEFRVPRRNTLSMEIRWSFDGFSGVPGTLAWLSVPWLVALAESEVRQRIRAALARPAPGRSVLGDDRFVIERPLSVPGFAGAGLSVLSAAAVTGGMTLGGPMQLPFDIGNARLSVSIREPWSAYSYVLMGCLSPKPKLSGPVTPDLAVSGTQVSFAHSGTELQRSPSLRAIEHLTPGDWLAGYIRIEPEPVITLRLDLPAVVAAQIREPIRMIVRTPRGVRLVELPPPPEVVLDAQGRVVGSWSAYVDWCPTLLASEPWRLSLGQVPISPGGQGGSVGGEDDGRTWLLPGPVHTPPGGSWPGAGGGPTALVQVLSFSGLEPGELIRFSSARHTVVVAANADGMSWLPVMLANPQAEGGEIQRLNGQSLAGRFSTRSVSLRAMGQIAADARPPSLQPDMQGATLTFGHGPQASHYTLGSWGGVVPQSAAAARPDLKARNVPADAALVHLPGLADTGLALQSQTTGPARVVRLATGQAPQVIGLFEGPLPDWIEAGSWGLARGQQRHGLYRIEGTPAEPACGCRSKQECG